MSSTHPTATISCDFSDTSLWYVSSQLGERTIDATSTAREGHHNDCFAVSGWPPPHARGHRCLVPTSKRTKPDLQATRAILFGFVSRLCFRLGNTGRDGKRAQRGHQPKPASPLFPHAGQLSPASRTLKSELAPAWQRMRAAPEIAGQVAQPAARTGTASITKAPSSTPTSATEPGKSWPRSNISAMGPSMSRATARRIGRAPSSGS